MMQAKFSFGGIWVDDGEKLSHVDGSGFVVIVAVKWNLVISFVIEKASKCELKEAVMEGFAVDELIAEGIVGVAGAVTQLVRVDGIKVWCVGWVNDFRLKRRLLTSQFLRPINLVEERMILDLVNIFSDPFVFTLAQSQNNVGSFFRELCLWRDVECLSPMNHLRITEISSENLQKFTEIKAHFILRFFRRICQERRLTDEHFIQNHADTPPITKLCVATP